MAVRSKPFYIVNNEIRAIVRVASNSSRNALIGITHEGDGNVAMRATVTAVSESGKASIALLKLLATELKLHKPSMSIIKGATTRKKTVEIANDPKFIHPILETWIDRIG